MALTESTGRSALIGLLAAAAGGAALLATTEARVVAHERESAFPGSTEGLPPWCSEPERSRLMLSCARLAARTAAAMPADRRQSMVIEARRFIAAALHERPGWPDALIEQAFLLQLTDAPVNARARALAETYRAAHYLRQAGLWRIAQGASLWESLSPTTRAAVAAEAAWYERIDSASGAAVARTIAGTPLEVRMLLRR